MYEPQFVGPMMYQPEPNPTVNIISMDEKCKKCQRTLVDRKFWSELSNYARLQARREFACSRGRGLCGGCYETLRRDGDLADFERKTMALPDFVEDYQIYYRRTTNKRQIAKLMGMKYKALEKAYYRAKEKGLL